MKLSLAVMVAAAVGCGAGDKTPDSGPPPDSRFIDADADNLAVVRSLVCVVGFRCLLYPGDTPADREIACLEAIHDCDFGELSAIAGCADLFYGEIVCEDDAPCLDFEAYPCLAE